MHGIKNQPSLEEPQKRLKILLLLYHMFKICNENEFCNNNLDNDLLLLYHNDLKKMLVKQTNSKTFDLMS